MGFNINNIPQISPAEIAKGEQEDKTSFQQETAPLGGGDLMFSNPMVRQSKFTSLDEHLKKRKVGTQETKEEEPEHAERTVIKEVVNIDDIAKRYQEKNRELEPKSLRNLRSNIFSGDSIKDILTKVITAYQKDYFLTDEALDFLIETSSSPLTEKLQEAKVLLNTEPQLLSDDIKKEYGDLIGHGSAVRAGRNVAFQSLAFAEQGAGTSVALRDLYNMMIQNPKEPAVTFTELTSSFPFDKLRKVLAFVLHAAGDDFKSKGPSIEKGELANLFKEVKAMQAILQVFRFFKSRMKGMGAAFERAGLTLPSQINFESLSKAFVKLLLDPYPSTDKIYQMLAQLGVKDES